MHFYRLPLLVVLFFFALAAHSQYATVRGFVYEEESGEPVIFTNVYLAGTSHGASTDVNGYFMITRIPPGDYTLIVTYLGFDTLKIPLTLREEDVVTRQLYLEERGVSLAEVNISARRQEVRTETRTSVVKITPKDINQIPSIGGQPDLAQYLQVLPGVVFTGDQGGELYIRGGSPIQNKVLLDGMTIYKPFHSIGLFSVFETDMIRNADIYTGGFAAEYGGRISSVMDITTRDGNKQRIAGKVSASTFGSSLMVEGPIKKQHPETGGSSSSFVLSAKNSYLDESSEIFYKYADSNGLPFNFLDLYGKISINASNGSKVNFYGFHFTDRVDNYQSISDFHWNSTGVGTNFVVIPGRAAVLLEGHVAYSGFEMTLEEETVPSRSSSINGFDVGLDFTYFLGKDELKYGLQLQGFTTDYFFINATGRTIQQKENTTEIGFYGQYKAIIGKMILEPSIRVQWYASLSEMSPEPRLAVKYNVSDGLRLKLAGGLYSQNLISARSDRDVVNLFYGFLSGPDNIPSDFDGEAVTSRLQKATHAILGAEVDLTANLTLNLESYYKYFNQLTNLNRNKIFDEGKAPEQPDVLKKDFIIETGDAMGLDVILDYRTRNFSLWTVYSFAYVNRFYEDENEELQHYYPHFDRRHNFNIVGTLILGDRLDWELSARWNYGSGFPFTQTQGYYEKINFDKIYSDYLTVNGDMGILYGELNQGRLPDYHRLDINIKKQFHLSENSRIDIDASLVNVYNRKNVFYMDRITQETVYQLPIIPSLGITWRF